MWAACWRRLGAWWARWRGEDCQCDLHLRLCGEEEAFRVLNYARQETVHEEPEADDDDPNFEPL